MSDMFMQAIIKQGHARTRFIDLCIAEVNSKHFNKTQRKEIWVMQNDKTPLREIAEKMNTEPRLVLQLVKSNHWPTPSLLG